MDNLIIKTENIEYIYQKGMPFESVALKNISLSIKKGSFNALIGHTGSGKSTLIQLFNALLVPTGGKIFIDGEDIKTINPRELRRKVGLVFQYPEHQLFEETVYKDISYGPLNMGLSENEVKERVIEAANLTGISDELFDVSPFELSGGQKRRAAIAGVIAMRPSVLILDEPAAGLDPAGRREILSNIQKLHAASSGMTVILVSHSMEDAAEIADNIIVMNKGSIFASGTANEIFSRADELSAIGLDVPEITRITDKLRSLGIDIPKGIYTVSAAEHAILKALGKE